MTVDFAVIKALIFLFLALGMFFLINAVRGYEIGKKLLEKVDELDRKRVLGKKDKHFLQKYLDRLDEKLLQAGLKKYFPRAGVELYFLINLLEFTMIFCLIIFITTFT